MIVRVKTENHCWSFCGEVDPFMIVILEDQECDGHHQEGCEKENLYLFYIRSKDQKWICMYNQTEILVAASQENLTADKSPQESNYIDQKDGGHF